MVARGLRSEVGDAACGDIFIPVRDLQGILQWLGAFMLDLVLVR